MPPPRKIKTEFTTNPVDEARVRDIAIEVVAKAINDFKCQPQTITENWTFTEASVDFEGKAKEGIQQIIRAEIDTKVMSKKNGEDYVRELIREEIKNIAKLSLTKSDVEVMINSIVSDRLNQFKMDFYNELARDFVCKSPKKRIIGVEFTDEETDEWRQIKVYTWLPREQAAPELPTCSIAYLLSGTYTIQLTKGWSERPGVSPKSLEDCEETACWRAKGYLNITKQTWSGFQDLEIVQIHTNEKRSRFKVAVVENGQTREIETDKVDVYLIDEGRRIFSQ